MLLYARIAVNSKQYVENLLVAVVNLNKYYLHNGKIHTSNESPRLIECAYANKYKF